MRRSRCTSPSGHPLAHTPSVVCWVRSEVEQSTSSTPMPCSTSQWPGRGGVTPTPPGELALVVVVPAPLLGLGVAEEDEGAVLRCTGHTPIMHPPGDRCPPAPVPPGSPRSRCCSEVAEPVRRRRERGPMSAVDDILGALPADQISEQVGASPDEVRACSGRRCCRRCWAGCRRTPATPSGAGSILRGPRPARGRPADRRCRPVRHQHEQDGDGHREPHLRRPARRRSSTRLGALPAVGGSGLGGALVKKLLPILAPMVLSWLAKRVLKGGGGGLGGGTAAPAARRHLAERCPAPRAAAARSAAPARSTTCCATCSAAPRAAATGSGGPAGWRRRVRRAGSTPGSIIGDVLGGMLGGGRR